MKKAIIALSAALALAVAGLGAALFLLSGARESRDALLQQVSQLEEEKAELTGQIADLNQQLSQVESSAKAGGLATWAMDITPWADNTGADITLSAVPGQWHEALTGTLLVTLDGAEISNTPCQWDGEAFTATAALGAADGYSYTLVLTLPNGTQQNHPLTSPSNPALDIPVFLASSLTTYCNLIVEDWAQTDEGIAIQAAYIQVQLPRIGDTDGIESAQLVLTHNGTPVQAQVITLVNAETADSYALAITDLTLALPETEADDLLELQLEVTLRSGKQLNAIGISWYRNGDTLSALVG